MGLSYDFSFSESKQMNKYLIIYKQNKFISTHKYIPSKQTKKSTKRNKDKKQTAAGI